MSCKLKIGCWRSYIIRAAKNRILISCSTPLSYLFLETKIHLSVTVRASISLVIWLLDIYARCTAWTKHAAGGVSLDRARRNEEK